MLVEALSFLWHEVTKRFFTLPQPDRMLLQCKVTPNGKFAAIPIFILLVKRGTVHVHVKLSCPVNLCTSVTLAIGLNPELLDLESSALD